MSIDSAHDVLQSAFMTTLVVLAPLLAAIFATSLLINALQTMTQMHDHALSFVPRLVAAGVVTLLLLPWTLGRLTEYATEVYRAAGKS